MTDDLRTRIAAVLNDSPLLRASIPIYERGWAEQLADAVIRELKLTQQYFVDGIISDGEPRPWEVPCETRYATEWEPFRG